MDAGLAAVLGALAGAAGTTLAGLATGWSAREQARITARAEHQRQRRQPRHEVYENLIRTAASVRDHAGSRFAYDIVANPTLEYCHESEQLADTIKEQWIQVALAGPKIVEQPAADIARSAAELSACAYGFYSECTNAGDEEEHWEKGKEVYRRLQQELDVFISAAQEALDDDGTK
jgi:hypothetical protein